MAQTQTSAPQRRTKRERIHYGWVVDSMRQLEWDACDAVFMRQRLPEAWHRIERCDTRWTKTEKITARIDADVLKYFRAMGPGYQAKLNLVLRSFVHARLAALVDGPEMTDYLGGSIRDMPDRRPRLGETEAETGIERMDAMLQEMMETAELMRDSLMRKVGMKPGDAEIRDRTEQALRDIEGEDE